VVVGLRGRLATRAGAARTWLASIPRHCRRHVALAVALAVAVALLVQGIGLTNGQRDGRRPPADVEPTVQESARHGLGWPSDWRRPDPEPSPVRRTAKGPLSSWVARIVAGPSTLVDARGHRWQRDSGHVGGWASVTNARIEGTGTQSIYQHERWGMRGYIIQVPAPATYAINLYLAETRFSRPRQRVFDVSAEGVVKASDVDIIEAAGRNHAYHVSFTAVVTDGQLDLGFINKIDQAKVNGIEVAFLRRSTAARHLVWSDEFNGVQNSPVDSRRWRHETGGAWGEGELQSYTPRKANSHQDGRGRLRIVARAEGFRGMDSITRDYTSARISTQDRYSFRYGLFEARLKMPLGRGVWPAFWALGTDIDQVGWPECGEIDVMEHLGQEPTTASGTIHGPRDGGGANADYKPGRSVVHTTPLAQEFHTYGVQWLPGSIQFYFDGRPYWSITAADLPAGSRWVFDHPFFLILNIAIGGKWAGSPDASTTFPQALLVDYVRVYQ
jgi:beta-glucanase (GH16 family)